MFESSRRVRRQSANACGLRALRSIMMNRSSYALKMTNLVKAVQRKGRKSGSTTMPPVKCTRLE